MSSCYSDTGWDYNEKRDPQPCYYSERGEDCPPRTDATIQEYFANANSWEEYCYIYTTFGEWLCFEIDKKYNEDYSEIVETITRPCEIPAEDVAVV